MKQLLILSGKGGTGKTTFATAFIKLANAKCYADCDVDAPNLHIIMHQTSTPKITNYLGMPKAKINTDKCIQCELCQKHCKFDAILKKDIFYIDPFACEGCAVCTLVCPQNAISMDNQIAGFLTLYETQDDVFSTAELKMGNGTSGKLVTEVKKAIIGRDFYLAIIDGSPGIGCPVIASLNNVDMVLIVAEPSISGISDMERIVKTAQSFQIKIAICVNKYNINIENTKKIETFCVKHNIFYVGTVPFDTEAVKAINNRISITENDCISGSAIKTVFDKTINILLNNEQFY